MLSTMRTLVLATSALCVFSLPHQAHAAGFYIQEQSVSGLGASFAGSVSNLHDASTIYFNPAGMTRLDGAQGQLATHILIPDAELTNNGSTIPLGGASTGNGGNPYEPTPVPNMFVAYPVNDALWIGVGVTAPFGLGSEYDQGWFGRYDSTKTKLTVIDFQPTVAWKMNDWLSIGGGLNVQASKAVLRNAVTNGVTEGESTLDGKDVALGYTLSLQATPREGTTIGANYKSATYHQIDGTVLVTGVVGLNRNDNVHADLDLPEIASFGIAQELNDKWTLMGQANWFGWNSFDSIIVNTDAGATVTTIPQNYQTTWAFAAGLEYGASDKLTLRTGIQFDQTPTTDEFRTSRTPDGDRVWVSAGGTYDISEHFNLDFAATYIDVGEEDINVSRNGGLARVRAKTEGQVGILAAAITYKF